MAAGHRHGASAGRRHLGRRPPAARAPAVRHQPLCSHARSLRRARHAALFPRRARHGASSRQLGHRERVAVGGKRRRPSGTAHGHLLLAKLAVLVPALLLAAANRALLPALSGPNEAKPSATARRMALFIALEAGLVLAVLGLAAAMTVTTPAIHGDPIWPWPIRLSLDALPDVPVIQNLLQPRSELVLAGFGLALVAVAFLARRRRVLLIGSSFVLVAGGVAIGLPPLMVEAYPTSMRARRSHTTAARSRRGWRSTKRTVRSATERRRSAARRRGEAPSICGRA